MLPGRSPLRRFAAAILAVALASFADPAVARPPAAHIVIDAASGQELLSESPDLEIHPASLTKMMTLYLLFDELEAGRLKLDSRVPFSRLAAARPPSKLGVPAGSSISVETAILALAVKSGNDVAVAVAERLAGSVDAFADRMNRKARELGMARTRFVNPSGLHDPRQVSTPRDMARLARGLLYKHEGYFRFFKADSFSHGGRTYRTHNRFVQNYAGADGIKTGYVRASGFNLAGSAVRGGRRLIGVIIGGRSAAQRDLDLIGLMDAGFRVAQTLGPPRYAGVAPVAIHWDTGLPAQPPARPDNRPPPPAPAVAKAAPAATTTSAAPPRPLGVFAAQVGAVSSVEAAASLAASRLDALGPAVAGGEPSVAELRLKSGRRLFRARIDGLTRPQARSACAELKRSGRDCLVVGPPSSG